jgi:hypothetical protein
MEIEGTGGGACDGGGTGMEGGTNGAVGIVTTGSGIEAGGGAVCGLGNWPVAPGWTGILGSGCVEIGCVGGDGAGVGDGLLPAGMGRTGAVVTCVGWGAIVVDDAGGTSRICAVLTGLTLPVSGDAGVAWGGASPCSSSFLSSRMSKRRLTAAILFAVSVSVEV